MTITATKRTEYTVTFHWVAEAWAYEAGEQGDAPMTSSDPVTFTLPSGATPWQVYSEAGALDLGPEKDPDVSSWDADGMTIDFDGKSYSLSGYQIKPETTWSDFY